MQSMPEQNIVFNDGVIQPVFSHIIKDTKYNVTSYHDFLLFRMKIGSSHTMILNKN